MESRVNSTFGVVAQIDLAEAEVTSYGWKALAGPVGGFSMDGFDMLILGFMLHVISAALAAFTSTQAGSLVTWTMLGAVVGEGSLNSRFAVRYGRKQGRSILVKIVRFGFESCS
jgi:hypothetical protein